MPTTPTLHAEESSLKLFLTHQLPCLRSWDGATLAINNQLTQGLAPDSKKATQRLVMRGPETCEMAWPGTLSSRD